MKQKIKRKWVDETGINRTEFEPEPTPKSTWRKDQAYYTYLQKIPRNVTNMARWTRKNRS